VLKAILAVTILSPDLEVIEQAYAKWLGYRVAERGVVSEELATLWGSPAGAGRPYLLMQPESGERVYLRFIEAGPVALVEPMKTLGWGSTELLVTDPDALAARLEGSPFKIVGPPRPLSVDPKIRAMQVVGPANEMLYLTRLPPGAAGFDLGTAQTFVDRVFIMVVGGRKMEAMIEFYDGLLGLPATKPFPAQVTVINQAYGLAPEHKITMALAPLPKRFLVEIDEFPPQGVERPRPEGELPPGVAMVSFEVESLDAPGLEPLAPPTRIDSAPYAGRRSAIIKGPAGELLELVETPAR
jgi:catechol 2,3-dioxygenase-like lactoylglutathione lyase family enzyme